LFSINLSNDVKSGFEKVFKDILLVGCCFAWVLLCLWLLRLC
jgi:hypothetical protein